MNSTWLSHVRGESKWAHFDITGASVHNTHATCIPKYGYILERHHKHHYTPCRCCCSVSMTCNPCFSHRLLTDAYTDCSLMHTHSRSRGSGPQDQRYTCVKILPYTIRECLQLCHKNMAKHFRMAKIYCAQWQLNGGQCLTHDLCAIYTGFTQCDNCTIATVYIIKT